MEKVFGIAEPLPQQSQGALVFVYANDRTFVLSLGQAYHQLSQECYEHDSGLRVTLNCVDRAKIKNTDTVEPSTARRQRTQVPVDSDISFFDLNQDDSILKALTGKVKDEYRDLISAATGASSLRISSNVAADELPQLGAELLRLYHLDDFKLTFPEMQRISAVREPKTIRELEASLETAVREGTGTLRLSVPAIVDYAEAVYIQFEGLGAPSDVLESVFILSYFDYVVDRGADRADLSLSDLKKHHIRLVTDDGEARQGFSVYRSLLFESAADSENATYYLVASGTALTMTT